MFETHILIAFGLTLFAGLSTGIGSALAFFTKRTNTKLLSLALGFSAGVMLYVSFVEMMPIGFEKAQVAFGEIGSWYVVGSFFFGILSVAIIDRLIPSFENPHEVHKVEDLQQEGMCGEHRHLMRLGTFTAIALAIHNFPEGLVTFVSSLNDVHVGISIALAVAIHNIPEGIAVSVPIYYATKSRAKAFWYSFVSGLAEPLGAFLGCLFFCRVLHDGAYSIIFASVAGIMIFISLDELLPAARRYGEHHIAIYGLVLGMAVMAVSLLII
ncbi:MAG TPA: zinc transporter ZupT [Candidatus Magasanikbacteria bacterium]|nr:MAG: zinc transporter ZupT [Candidatus Magasanikbacteria bacterium RIFOXYC2_FULL_39_8]HAT03168.1 zinc transporter ZupT [Candidatus Magasanikbacteria bacterium]